MDRLIELLAPAKNYDAVRAAVDHGADAIYMGASRFGARAAARNSAEDIARAVEYAHQYGVKLFATLNTLIFEDELHEAERMARDVVAAGADALIIQDMSYVRMNLGCELHASTQMCNMTPDSVRFLRDLGFRRVVLERNLSLREISKIAREVDGVELEAFVHGAICVGYSGRCLLSRSTSQRSGNRGECSQPCRLPYDLEDGAGRKIVERKHLISVKDLNLSQRLGEMLDVGVSSFKIEGRLKEIGYTKNIVAHYRRELDRAMAQRSGFCRSSVGRSIVEFEPNPAKSFTRGETTYMFDGVRRDVASFESPKSKGEALGRCVATRRGSFAVEYDGEISTGDGICLVSEGALVGGGVNRVEREGDLWWLRLNTAAKVVPGSVIYRNVDRLFDAAVESSRTRRVVGVAAALVSSADAVEVRYRDVERGLSSVARVEGEFEPCKNMERMAQVIAEQLEKCGETIFESSGVDLSGWGGEFIPSSQLAQLRREALEGLRCAAIEQSAAARGAAVFVEQSEARYPARELGGEAGVTNSLAEQLYRDHGVDRIAPPFELSESFDGVRVLESSYCLRREMGECLKRGSKLRDPLFLVRGGERFRLEFNCSRCRMSLIKVQK